MHGLLKYFKSGILLLAGMFIFIGCTESSKSKNKADRFTDRGVSEPGGTNPGNLSLETQAQGDYAATWTFLNQNVIGDITGLANLRIQGDHFEIKIKMQGLAEYSAHAQYLHSTSRCPDISADTNGDSFLDGEEAEAVYGKILVPLDGDLSSQIMDYNVFPAANGVGKYYYRSSTALSLMLSDLMLEDTNPQDSLTKLNPSEALNLEGRAIVIYGVPTDIKLPATVRAYNGLNHHASLPIACGIITRVVEDRTDFME